jgi:asparagine synthase (glutamine-hydrolysing)
LCGIAGFTRLRTGASVGIRSAVQSIIHRGPDQQGIFESDLISLGVARLRILDLASGDQPIISANGDTVIAFNGEIYNHLELRRELEQRGHRFRSGTDTETVLSAFLEWDTDCFARMRGMFAVALWTESSRRLILARDRLGIKPLYLSRVADDIYFGSELKTLFIHPEIGRDLSLAALDCYLSLNYVPGQQSLVDGIEKLSPGHWLEWRPGKIHSEAYWRLPITSPRIFDFEAAQEELDYLLTESIREHLLSDVPLGVWLSGGLDSSTILHYAAQVSNRQLRTYSISFAGRSFDETEYIRQVAAQCGTKHEQFDLNPNQDLIGAVEQFSTYFDEPNADGGALPVWFLSKLTKQTATVAFSGEGADELFAGYLTHRANYLARFIRKLPAPVSELAQAAAHLLPPSDEKISFEYKLKRFLAGSRMSPLRAHVFWNGTFTDAEKRDLVRPELPAALDPLLRDASRYGDGLNAFLWFDQKFFLPDDILMKVDRMSMAHSVEVRPPFLDHRLVEFAASLPPHFKLRGSRQKVILRELMRSKLPPAVTRRKKVGLDFPAHEWLRGPLRELLLDTLSSAESRYSDLFHFDAIRSCLDAHLSRRANLGYNLWGLMLLFLWMERWRIQFAHQLHPQSANADHLLTYI